MNFSIVMIACRVLLNEAALQYSLEVVRAGLIVTVIVCSINYL